VAATGFKGASVAHALATTAAMTIAERPTQGNALFLIYILLVCGACRV
jgi:hypothetical protein